MPWLRRLVAGISQRSTRFASGSVYVGFVVDKVALGQVSSEFFGFPCQYHSNVALYTYIVRGMNITPMVPAVQGQSLAPLTLIRSTLFHTVIWWYQTELRIAVSDLLCNQTTGTDTSLHNAAQATYGWRDDDSGLFPVCVTMQSAAA
jgi:hypothetical protein